MSVPTLPAGVIATDGASMPVGSQVLTINAVTYVGNNLSIDRSVTNILRKSEYGLPSAETLLVNQFTGDGELQLATWDTVEPPIGAPFTMKIPGGATVHCKVTGTSPKYKQDGETMCGFKFNQQLNPGS